MSIYRYLGLEDARVDGACSYSGADTKNRLPNGDFVAEDVVSDFLDRGWLTPGLQYTVEFFRAHKHLQWYTDKDGLVHAIGPGDLLEAVESGRADAALWVARSVELDDFTIGEALRLAVLNGVDALRRPLLAIARRRARGRLRAGRFARSQEKP
jgi:hypothetical protein